MEARFGWRRLDASATSLWFKGYLNGSAPESLLDALARWATAPDIQDFGRWVGGLDGHFALAVETPGWLALAVDRVRSIPLFVARAADRMLAGADAPGLAERLDLGDVAPDAALALAMAGYTVGWDALIQGVRPLLPGECAVLAGGDVRTRRYALYRPWRVVSRTGAAWRNALVEATDTVFDKLVASTAGRPIAVPLSAGLDSRLVASALRHRGVRDVRLFAYGIPGNHEATASRVIAERLGYPWTFVPVTRAAQADLFRSAEHDDYLRFADSLTAVPFRQDFLALRTLHARGWLPADAVIVNGNSGDYITGNHIPPVLRVPPPAGLGAEARLARVIDALVAKHFALWRSLATPTRRVRIAARLRAALHDLGAAPDDPAGDHGLYEASEFEDRQCKYVIAGQRIYEFLGFDWRLPLWDLAYLDLWEGVPLELKAGQRLYRETLAALDWGGVWQPMDWPRTVAPAWIRPLRLAAKLACAPLGRGRWHRVERRLFEPLTDTLGNMGAVPYRTALLDDRGWRHAVAWFAETYLAGKGIRLADL
jgi:asparagine synthase (glutamine-hydrolysing)